MPGGNFGEPDRERGRHPDPISSRLGYYNEPLDYEGRSDYDMRKDYSVHGYNPGRHDRGEGEPKREVRSRTPGPDFMRGTNVQDEYMRQRPPEIRSKTPTHELHYAQHHNISGTPDFIPASRYLPSNGNHVNASSGYSSHQQGSPARPAGQDAPYTRPNYDGPNINRQRPVSGPDLTQPPYGGVGMNSAHTYAGSLNYASGHNVPQNRSFDSYGSGYASYPDRMPLHPHDVEPVRPRKQSTSFEHEEPAPTNLTRIPRGERYTTDSPSSSLNRSRSPTRFGEDDRCMELTVFLKRQESGFGFRIIGGTEEGSQVGIETGIIL